MILIILLIMICGTDVIHLIDVKSLFYAVVVFSLVIFYFNFILIFFHFILILLQMVLELRCLCVQLLPWVHLSHSALD